MSYILDALKQSERQRNRQAAATQPSMPAEVQQPAAQPFYHRRWLWLIIILILAIPLGVGLGRLGADKLGLTPSSTPAPPPIVAPPNSPRILVEEPPAVSLNEPSPTPLVRPDTARHSTVQNAIPPLATTTAPPEPVPPQETAFDPGVPDIRALPAAIRSRLPELTLSVHIYSPDPAARMLNINGHMLREGENIGGLTIKHITPKGVILGFEGNDFHLYSVGG